MALCPRFCNLPAGPFVIPMKAEQSVQNVDLKVLGMETDACRDFEEASEVCLEKYPTSWKHWPQYTPALCACAWVFLRERKRERERERARGGGGERERERERERIKSWTCCTQSGDRCPLLVSPYGKLFVSRQPMVFGIDILWEVACYLAWACQDKIIWLARSWLLKAANNVKQLTSKVLQKKGIEKGNVQINVSLTLIEIIARWLKDCPLGVKAIVGNHDDFTHGLSGCWQVHPKCTVKVKTIDQNSLVK